MGNLFKTPKLPPPPPPPPAPKDESDVVNLAALMAQRQSVAGKGFRSAFASGPRGEGGPAWQAPERPIAPGTAAARTSSGRQYNPAPAPAGGPVPSATGERRPSTVGDPEPPGGSTPTYSGGTGTWVPPVGYTPRPPPPGGVVVQNAAAQQAGLPALPRPAGTAPPNLLSPYSGSGAASLFSRAALLLRRRR